MFDERALIENIERQRAKDSCWSENGSTGYQDGQKSSQTRIDQASWPAP